MSDVLNRLKSSADPLERDLAMILDAWADMKRGKGQRASLGYEPRDINAFGAVAVISRRVLSASAGFEEVDPEQSYEALVLRYPERFDESVIAAAQERMSQGASKLRDLQQQDIQFFIKSSAIELFGEGGVQSSIESWVGRSARIPELHLSNIAADKALEKGFRSFVWLHEEEKGGERGRGLTAVVEFGPLTPERRAKILDAFFFKPTIGRDFLAKHKGDGTFAAAIDASRHSRTWPIPSLSVDQFLTAARLKAQTFAEISGHKPDPFDPLNLEKIEDRPVISQIIQRRNQTVFRNALLKLRPKCCAITGTIELSVLEAAHIIPYAERFANRDNPKNGLILRSDIHSLFDAYLISINPVTRTVEVSRNLQSPDYLTLGGNIVPDDVSSESLEFHFENFQKKQG